MRKYTAVAFVAIGLFMVSSMAIAAADGAALFKAKCAVCHGADKKGNPAMSSLGNTDITTAKGHSEAELTATITKGRAKMPAFEGKLTAEEISALVAEIKK